MYIYLKGRTMILTSPRKCLFFQRIKLFNAYAMKKMCEAGIPVLDVYHISAAYPHGTIDGIHYPHFVFHPAEDALEKYFTT